MGDRLIIEVKDGKETYAMGYFHYGAVIERMIGLVACMIDALPENTAPQMNMRSMNFQLIFLKQREPGFHRMN